MSSDVPAPSPRDEPPGLSPEPNEFPVVEEPQPPSVPKVRGWHRPLVGTVFLLGVCYVVIWPVVVHLLDDFNPGADKFRLESTPISQAIELQALKAFAILWIAVLGGTVGSFLNVVAFRMPRGKSVIFSPSRCPKCNSNIRPTDNVPVLGWLRLEGKCRACHNPISPQYPIVEAVVAGLFLLLFAVEMASGGANLPLRTPNSYRGIVWILFELRWDLIQLYLYHCSLFCLLVAWVLVDLDRQRVTWLAVLVGIGVLVVPLLIWPHLLPVPVVWPTISYLPSLPRTLIASWVGGAAGIALGLALGLALKSRTMSLTSLRPIVESPDPNLVPDPNVTQAETSDDRTVDADPGTSEATDRTPEIRDYCCVQSQLNLVSAMAFCGFALGWQAAATIAILGLAIRTLCLIPMSKWRFQLPLMTFLVIAALVHHLIWRWLSKLVGSVITDSSYNLPGLAYLTLVLIALIGVNRLSLNPTRVHASQY